MQTGYLNNDYVYMAQCLMQHGFKGRKLLNVNLTLLTPRNRLLSLQSSPVAMHDLLASFVWHMKADRKLNEETSLVAFEHDMRDVNNEEKDYTDRNIGHHIFNLAVEDEENQWGRVASILAHDSENPNTVLHMSDRRDVFWGNRDVCPSSTAQFLIVDDALNLIVTNTETDFINQLPHDVFFWTLIHELMLTDLKFMGKRNLKMGQFILNSNLLYVDESQMETLEEIANDKGQDIPMIDMGYDLTTTDLDVLQQMATSTDEEWEDAGVELPENFWFFLGLSLRFGDVSALHKLFGQDH